MKDQSDSRKQSPKPLSRTCDFCDNKAEIFTFQVLRGTFKERYFCSSCASSHVPSSREEEEKPKSIEEAVQRLKSDKKSESVGKMVESDFKNEQAAKPPLEFKKNKKGEKERVDCFCCGTKKSEILESGVFPCSHCYDSFPELKDKFPEQFEQNLKELQIMINIAEMEDKIAEAEEFLKSIPEKEKETDLYRDTVEKIKRIKKRIEEHRKNE